MGDIPNSVGSLEFVALVGLGLQGLGLLGELSESAGTLSMSAARDLFEDYFTTLLILTEVEYRAYIRPLIFIYITPTILI
jgi:hypothetical protein